MPEYGLPRTPKAQCRKPLLNRHDLGALAGRFDVDLILAFAVTVPFQHQIPQFFVSHRFAQYGLDEVARGAIDDMVEPLGFNFDDGVVISNDLAAHLLRTHFIAVVKIKNVSCSDFEQITHSQALPYRDHTARWIIY